MFRLRNQTIEGKRKKKKNRSYFVMLSINTKWTRTGASLWYQSLIQAWSWSQKSPGLAPSVSLTLEIAKNDVVISINDVVISIKTKCKSVQLLLAAIVLNWAAFDLKYENGVRKEMLNCPAPVYHRPQNNIKMTGILILALFPLQIKRKS